MPVQMFLYLPIDVNVNDSEYVVPTIENQSLKITEILNDPSLTAEQENDDNGGGRYNQATPEMKAVSKFHKNSGWFTILAYSHGMSGKHVQDVSVTKFCDDLSPQMSIMVIKGDTLPFAVLRVVYKPDDGKVTILETEMKNVKVTSISTGGSGGEDKFTENICVEAKTFIFKKLLLDIISGDILTESIGSWDEVNKKATRRRSNVATQPKSLTDLAKEGVINNKDQMTKTSLQAVQNMNLITPGELNVEPLPEKGRRLVVTPEDSRKSREIFLKSLTFEALREAVAKVYNKEVTDITSIYYDDNRGRSIEILGNEQVLSLEEDDTVFFEVVKKEEEEEEGR